MAYKISEDCGSSGVEEVRARKEDEESASSTLSDDVVPWNQIILSAEAANCSKAVCSNIGANID